MRRLFRFTVEVHVFAVDDEVAWDEIRAACCTIDGDEELDMYVQGEPTLLGCRVCGTDHDIDAIACPCPKCAHRNAMLYYTRDPDEGLDIYRCRDCRHEIRIRRPA